jgi:hypothetical protein
VATAVYASSLALVTSPVPRTVCGTRLGRMPGKHHQAVSLVPPGPDHPGEDDAFLLFRY